MPSRNDWLDAALYPDSEPPARLDTLAARVDFVARLCAAWDFGRLPSPETVAEVRRVARGRGRVPVAHLSSVSPVAQMARPAACPLPRRAATVHTRRSESGVCVIEG
jgi:hypothetical protein